MSFLVLFVLPLLGVVADEPKDDVSLSGEMTFEKTEESFENATAWVRLWEYDPRLADAGADLFGDKKIAELKHTKGEPTLMQFKLDGKKKINPERQYYVTIFVYKDGKVGDNASEIFFLNGFNKVTLPGKIEGVFKKLNR